MATSITPSTSEAPGTDPATTPSITLSDLEAELELWYKIHVFVFDLRRWKERPDSQARLELVFDACYLGAPYFTDDQVTKIKNLAVGSSSLAQRLQDTLQERLERRMKKRVESNDYRVCAAHDLAPIFEDAFRIKEKDLSRNQDFVVLVDKCGLELGDNVFSGLKQNRITTTHTQKKQQRKKR